MAACGDNEQLTPSENQNSFKSFFRNHDNNATINTSRSPSISSFEFLVSKPQVEKISNKARDPVVIERRNLVNISKLIVKELIETSFKYGRSLDSDHMPLQHFFIVLEHALRHGLRPKKGLLGPKKELWDILQVVEKLTSEAQDITSSVRDLPTVKTQMGRARAWLRLALMQKKLGDYLKLLIDRRDDILSEYFEPDALLMSDEAIIIVGLLIGLNVIDCNLCIKEEDLDCQQGVIDFSLYLRSSHQASVGGDTPDEDFDADNMNTAVLDQKNYLEELNRHLNATVANLQAKVDSLTTTNALMKEDLAISKKKVATLTEENLSLRASEGNSKKKETADGADEGSSGGKDMFHSNEIDHLKHELESEKKKAIEVQRELDLQISLRAEMEMAMKLLDKDIHDKQETITSLRGQLDDIKQINLEMCRKLQDAESSLKHKTELVSKLQAKTSAMTDMLQVMGNKQKEVEKGKTETEKALIEAAETSAALSREREMRLNLEDSVTREKDTVQNLEADLKTLTKKYFSLQGEKSLLDQKCQEQEETLEELGKHLSASKLEISELKELTEQLQSEENNGTVNWVSDKSISSCKQCLKEFNLTRRKHHCRLCGDIFCAACSDHSAPIPPSTKPVRLCTPCHDSITNQS